MKQAERVREDLLRSAAVATAFAGVLGRNPPPPGWGVFYSAITTSMRYLGRGTADMVLRHSHPSPRPWGVTYLGEFRYSLPRSAAARTLLAALEAEAERLNRGEEV